jgi:hypothetical protein
MVVRIVVRWQLWGCCNQLSQTAFAISDIKELEKTMKKLLFNGALG